MKNWLVIFISLMLVACANVPVVPKTEQFFSDHIFSAKADAINVENIFALNEKMRQYLHTEIEPHLRAKGNQQGLFDALYTKQLLMLEYDSVMTKNAAQTFESRSGNCLSLAIMTAAFAREIGLTVEFQSIAVDDAWSRNGDLYITAGHVNVSLNRKELSTRSGSISNPTLTIDFLPPEENASHRLQVISEKTILAMYFNNRAAELLVQGKLDEAYWAVREAIIQDANFINSYNTLGVIYQRHGNVEQAHAVLNFAFTYAPENTSILSNLIFTNQSLGKLEDAKTLSAKLAQLQPYPPFHFFHLGQAAMKRENFVAAKDLFSKEIDRDPSYHEFYFWLAQAYYRLGELKQANVQMAIAYENSTTHYDRDLYAAKLSRLKAIQRQ